MNAKATSVVSTKGGVGKSTTAANLGAFCADAGLKTLLIDLDPVQPSLSSYYELPEVAQGGIYDLLAANITDPARIISRTIIPNLDVVISNDQNNQLNNLLLQAPDGRLRLANLMPSLKQDYDLVLIDTQGARSALLEMVVLASDLVVSPPAAQHAHCPRVQPRHNANARWTTSLRAPRHADPQGSDRHQLSGPDQ